MDPQEVVLQVVMVDDEEALCQGVRRIIERYHVHVPDVLVDASYEYRYFTTGEDFLVYLSEGGAVDLLLLDLKLPGIGGMDVLDALSDTGRDVLTIMITAYATFETAVKATKLGAYDFLAKPFTPDELRYAVRKATSQLILSRQARKLAEEKRQVRFNFISVLAHELKAPLNAVEGYLNILATTEAEQNLAMVERSIVRVDGMKKLISDLLDLTRIESGQRERSIRRLDLPELARGSIELFAGDAARRDITVTLDAPDDVQLVADAGEVEIVLNNLVSNAIKYNRDGGRVTVRLARVDGRRRDRRRRHRHRSQARRGSQALPRVHAHQERAHGQGPRQRPGPLDGAQDRDDVRRRGPSGERGRRRQHLHRDAQGRAADPWRPPRPPDLPPGADPHGQAERTPASGPLVTCLHKRPGHGRIEADRGRAAPWDPWVDWPRPKRSVAGCGPAPSGRLSTNHRDTVAGAPGAPRLEPWGTASERGSVWCPGS